MTQMYNCHKLSLFEVGHALSIEELDKYDPNEELLLKLLQKAYLSSNDQVQFVQHLLKDDERLSKMDLEYWIDYVKEFGVKELIPLYDGMPLWMYRNWDVYASTFIMLLALIYLLLSAFKFMFNCLSCCCKSK